MNPLDPLLSSGLRLGVMSVLIKLKSASFVYLKNELGSTQGNLSVQLGKLHQSGYIKIIKGFKGRYPETNCSITAKGINAFEAHVKNLKNTYAYKNIFLCFLPHNLAVIALILLFLGYGVMFLKSFFYKYALYLYDGEFLFIIGARINEVHTCSSFTTLFWKPFLI